MGPNGGGAYSEGQFDACEEVANAVQKMQKSDLPECLKLGRELTAVKPGSG